MKGVVAVHEGIDASSFGAGWMAAAGIFTVIGMFLRKIILKAKDEQITMLIKRIEHLEGDNLADRDYCQRRIDALNARIAILEAMTLGAIRQHTQAAISEVRIREDNHDD